MRKNRFSEEQKIGILRQVRTGITMKAVCDLGGDNGSEFVAYALLDGLKEEQIKTLYIQPESPWEKGHIESFHADCAMNVWTAKDSARWRKRAPSLRAGAWRNIATGIPAVRPGYQAPEQFAPRGEFARSWPPAFLPITRRDK